MARFGNGPAVRVANLGDGGSPTGRGAIARPLFDDPRPHGFGEHAISPQGNHLLCDARPARRRPTTRRSGPRRHRSRRRADRPLPAFPTPGRPGGRRIRCGTRPWSAARKGRQTPRRRRRRWRRAGRGPCRKRRTASRPGASPPPRCRRPAPATASAPPTDPVIRPWTVCTIECGITPQVRGERRAHPVGVPGVEQAAEDADPEGPPELQECAVRRRANAELGGGQGAHHRLGARHERQPDAGAHQEQRRERLEVGAVTVIRASNASPTAMRPSPANTMGFVPT